MSDPADNAQAASDALLTDGLAGHGRRRSRESAAPINWRGMCEDCGEPIAPARLAANPRAFRCVACQTDQERRAR